MKVDVMIPTYKPDKKFIELVKRLEEQTLEIEQIIVINTEEQYMNKLFMGTRFLAEHKKLKIFHISKHEFDHGLTRNYGAKKSDADILVYMTQDAMPSDNMLLEKLIAPLQQENVAVSYARQLPAKDATVAECITREFNYPDKSRIKTKSDLKTLGIKTFFCSNVCAAYKKSIFKQLGGFVNHTIFNEDMIFAGKAVEAGYGIAYAADACVIHSHNYTWRQQFKRNFDLGVSQADHPEVFSGISSESEGKKMVKLAIDRMKKEGHKKAVFPYIIMSGFKFLGYRAGKMYKKLPKFLVKKWSMSPNYWIKK